MRKVKVAGSLEELMAQVREAVGEVIEEATAEEEFVLEDEELMERRKTAGLALIEHAKFLGEKYGLCPACLLGITAHYVEVTGAIEHLGDEDQAATVQ